MTTTTELLWCNATSSSPQLSSNKNKEHMLWCNSSNPCEQFVFSTAQSLTAGVSASALALVGSVLNLVTIVALLRYSKTRYHVTTPFVISLAFSDFLFSSVTLPTLAVKFFARFERLTGVCVCMGVCMGEWVCGCVGVCACHSISQLKQAM